MNLAKEFNAYRAELGIKTFERIKVKETLNVEINGRVLLDRVGSRWDEHDNFLSSRCLIGRPYMKCQQPTRYRPNRQAGEWNN